ncbi:MAG: RluA family pseudouridine synthase, partial [Muribaculaceae bacterium]|nr:RluA family pseudouridine synthase [Muribaculaceae bacterium]
NQWFCVVNKPCGMLSVPGKGTALSLQQWLQDKYGDEPFVKLVHRLDQDTSGLVIAALSPQSFKALQRLFSCRKVKKTYVADLEGDFESLDLPRQDRIELSLSPDWLDRPRQRIDMEGGKDAVTEYRFEKTSEGRSRVIFYPLTGRTHQLRVHSASSEGLGMPIVGDRLYGINTCSSLERLHLHAQKIEFTFPIDNQHYSFESPVPF